MASETRQECKRNVAQEKLDVSGLDENATTYSRSLVGVPAAVPMMLRRLSVDLTSLTIEACDLPAIPEQLYKLVKLEELNLRRNRIEQLSDKITKLRSLRVLNLMDNLLRMVPESALHNLKFIEVIKLDNVRIFLLWM